MINPRLLIQIPLFLIGSCAPLQPQINVTVGSTEETILHSKRLASERAFRNALTHQDPTSCRGVSLKELDRYEYPPLPDLTNIRDDDDEAQRELLLTYIERLRGELGSLAARAKCTLEQQE